MYNHNNSSNMIDSLMFALNGSSKADGLYEAHDGQGDLKICVACTWCGAPWTLLSLVRFQPFSRGHAMWCTCRSDISSSCLPTPTLYALPGVASAVPASCPGEACCLFRFMQIFVPIPSVYSYVKIHFSLNACKQGIGWLRRLFYLPLQSTGRRFKSWRGLVTCFCVCHLFWYCGFSHDVLFMWFQDQVCM